MDRQSQSGTDNFHFNTPAVSITNKLNDGDQFVLITRPRGSDQPQIWSSGDAQQTQQLLTQVSVDRLETTG